MFILSLLQSGVTYHQIKLKLFLEFCAKTKQKQGRKHQVH